MNKQKFNSLLNNYSSITDEDRQGLEELVSSYPYSQLLHTLLAKANHDAKTPTASSTLNRAAMYVSDRQLLKSIILESGKSTVQTISTPKQPIEANKATNVKKSGIQINQAKQIHITIPTESFTQSSDLLRKEIWADLEHLKESKANYLDWLDKSNEDEAAKSTLKENSPVKKPTIAKSAATKKTPTSTIKKEPDAEESEKAAAKASTATKTKKLTTKKDTVKNAPTKKVAEVKESVTKTAKPKKKAVSAAKAPVKKKAEVKSKPIKTALDEQIKIIDSFIDKKPSISSRAVKTVESDQKDLSVDSTTFGEDLVSENLAQILIEQGKNEKAIDIYKKLIWKFPQKKSYFAAQIEALTK